MTCGKDNTSSNPRASTRLDAVMRAVEALHKRGVTLIGSFPEGGPLDDFELSAINAAAIGTCGRIFLQHASDRNVFKDLDGPAVIDVCRCLSAWAAEGEPEDSKGLTRALLAGRLRLQGTDGVRGTVAQRAEGDPVVHFGRTGELTASLVEILCYAFGRMARRAGIARKLTNVAVAEDGRDAATGWSLSAAMRKGLTDAGLTVINLAVAPTPVVPFACVTRDIPLGVVLTASHNPATQNGVKFFINGLKMLPEGESGDFALSAIAYMTAHEEARGKRRNVEEGRVEDGAEVVEEYIGYVIENLPEGAVERLRKVRLVFDPANGAYTRIGQRIFERLGLSVATVNNEPRGVNINAGGGVAELEGKDVVSAQEAKGSPALGSVAAMIELASSRASAAQGAKSAYTSAPSIDGSPASIDPVYGAVMDGDGDRGYAVVGTVEGDAFIVQGDAASYVIARDMLTTGRIPESEAREHEFVGTVESDLMLFREVEARLGLPTRIGCVGDKWLVSGRREGRKLAVAEEVSGHVLWPTRGRTPGGGFKEVLTGNGLLTALCAIDAALRMGLSPREFAQPFARGVSLTRYTYNVNKALLFPGSRAWEADLTVIRETLETAKGKGFIEWRVIEKVDEPDMLYVGLFDGEGGLAGAVFVRNSGTENKTAVYGRGAASLEPLLERLCLMVWQMHRKVLKDRESAAYAIEAAALDALADGPRGEEEIAGAVAKKTGHEVTQGELKTVLYGMRKEGLVSFAGGRIGRIEEEG